MSDIFELLAALQDLQTTLERMEGKKKVLLKDLRKLRPGRYEGFTVYRVGKVRVTGYTRSGFKAVRITK